MRELLGARKYQWNISNNQAREFRTMLAHAQFSRQLSIFAAGEIYHNSYGDVVTLVKGIVPKKYQVKCSIGCLSLLQDELGDPVLL